jgi:acetyltransferase
MEKLDKLFNPKTIAVIGATSDKSSVGYAIMNNLIGNDYEGIVYPVNLKRKSVLGVKAYPSVTDISDKIDLAIIATPAATVIGIVKECGLAGVSGIVIISAGFQETGRNGEKLGQEILAIAKNYGMRILGPNCLGFIRPKLGLNASFAADTPNAGNVAFISQSGALCSSVLDWSLEKNIGFSYFVSIGSMLDIGFHDLIDYFNQDPNTSCILIYMESLTDARKFLSAAQAFSRTKPIIVLKVGKSLEGARAAKSHTGSLAGNDDIYDAAFKRAGIVRVRSIDDLFDNAQTLAMQPHPRGSRLAIITNAGGPGVIATDALIANGGILAKLSDKSVKYLDAIMPPAWSRNNPIDILGDAGAEAYKSAIRVCLDDENIDGILVILTPQAMTDSSSVAKEIVELSHKRKKTILAAFMGEKSVDQGRKILEGGNIPVFSAPENAVRSFLYMHSYTKNRELLYETPGSFPHAFRPKTEKNKVLLANVIGEGRMTLTEAEAKDFLANYQIPTAKGSVAKNAEEAAMIAANIGFPVVMKIMSADILHKTDIGGVVLDIKSKDEVWQAYGNIIKAAKKYFPKARLQGVLVEQMVNKKYELLIGCQKDPLFGPAIVFGMGGVAVEIFKDTNIGLPPLNMALSMRLMEDTKIYRLLKGYRGMPGVDVESIQFLLYKFAYLVSDFPEIKELDINPFAVDENGGVVLDAKVILDEKIIFRESKDYEHLVISPYPKEYVSRFKLSGGLSGMLRPIRPEDEDMERALIETFSEKTHRQRFFKIITDISHELLTSFTHIDYYREIAIIAEIEDKGKKKFIGVVRLIADANEDSADFAMAVGDPWQFKGLGNKLADYIMAIAKQRGIKRLTAKCLPDNKPMLDILAKRKFVIRQEGKFMLAKREINEK